MKTKKIPGLAVRASLWIVLMLAARGMEMALGFDEATGLSLHNIWSWLPPLVMLAAVLTELLAARRLPALPKAAGEKFSRQERKAMTPQQREEAQRQALKRGPGFRQQFAVPEQKDVVVVVIGAMLLVFGGLIAMMEFFRTRSGAIQVVTGLLAAASGVSLLLFTRSLRREDNPVRVGPLVAVLFFCAFLTLLAYRPAGTDPVLSRYWLPVLAAALLAAAWASLAGFVERESCARRFAPLAVLALTAASGALVSRTGVAMTLLYGGSAVALAGFLALLRVPEDACRP